jgi:hypothetical protein
MLALLALAVGAVTATVLQARPRGVEASTTKAASSAEFTELTGIRLVRVTVTGHGGLLDVRFQAVDPEKALVVHEAGQPIRIVDEATGTVVSTPFHQHSGGRLVRGITYYELFNNSHHAIRQGSPVTFIVGGVRLEHVRVR